MARARNIKPGTMENEALAALPPLHRLLWIYLWMLADREGRLEDRPARIKARALPYDEADVTALLRDLHNTGFIVRYAVDGRRFIQVVNFSKHQKPHGNEPESRIPPPPGPDGQEHEELRLLDEGLGTKVISASDFGDKDLAPKEQALGPCISDCLIAGLTDSLIAGEGSASRSSKRKPREKGDSRGTRLPAGWTLPDEWAVWAMHECEFSPSMVRRTAERFANHWHGAPGAKARKCDWFATWRNWCLGDLERETRAHGPPFGPSPRELREDRDRAMVTVLTGRDPWGPPPDVIDLAPEDVCRVPDRRH
ncbi:hypothetical protein [Paraburkholderia adhaesiva]|uniref:hypothetical protein n=1 Tax=Paraburkholderia adhaesiva TaxID=2883244 RepID=UPI001F3846CC|nr:hypothetical protein [Paraburkholderia adhaesiva]